MFMIGKRLLSQADKSTQAARFAKKVDNPKRDNARMINAMRLKLAAK